MICTDRDATDSSSDDEDMLMTSNFRCSTSTSTANFFNTATFQPTTSRFQQEQQSRRRRRQHAGGVQLQVIDVQFPTSLDHAAAANSESSSSSSDSEDKEEAANVPSYHSIFNVDSIVQVLSKELPPPPLLLLLLRRSSRKNRAARRKRRSNLLRKNQSYPRDNPARKTKATSLQQQHCRLRLCSTKASRRRDLEKMMQQHQEQSRHRHPTSTEG